MKLEAIYTHGRLVLADRLLDGSLSVSDGHIAGIDPGRSGAPGAIDLEGDLLIPGVIDLHTDNLERQVEPRPNARWPSRSAMIAHDAQCAAAGITTVFDSFCVGDPGVDEDLGRTLVDGVADIDLLSAAGLLKSEHLLHLRCELPAPDMAARLASYADHPRLRFISLMDHSPGVGQWGTVSEYCEPWRRDGVPEDEIERRLEQHRVRRARWRAPNKRLVLDRMRGRGITIASHDDRTEGEIAESFADGVAVSEFPVSMEAALAARARGMQVIAGAPNVVRGGSHSGNVAAADLLRASAVDALASDYVPASLIEAAFMASGIAGITLPEAIALITDRPARMARLPGRGRIEVGMAADLVQVRVHEGMPIVRAVWRRGRRVA